MVEKWHELIEEEVLKKLKSSTNGLSEQEAELRLVRYGYNQIAEKEHIKKWKIFLLQFKSPLIYILIAAAIISLSISHLIDFFVILAILIFNALVGFFQEYKAEKAISELKSMLVPSINVMRAGRMEEVPAYNLVPGDILILKEGDNVPADARVLIAGGLEVNQAVLTGESMPIEKESTAVRGDSIIERRNMLFMGTSIAAGKATAVIVATAMQTEFGKIASIIQEPELEITPLNKKIGIFSKQIAVLVVGLVIILALIGILKGFDKMQILLLSINLAVAAIPEGLPAVLTLTLTFAVRRMLRVKALIRKLPAAETLGRVTVICSDKTGTMTREELEVITIFCDNKAISINEKFMSYLEGSETARMLLKAGCLSSNARYEKTTGRDGKERDYFIGDATEKAILKIAHKYGFVKEMLTKHEPRVKEFSFSSNRKMMSIVRRHENELIGYIKGSPEAILQRCNKEMINNKLFNLSDERREKLLRLYERMASQALRVIAVAYKRMSGFRDITQESAEYGLTFLGFQGMLDAPREEVKGAIEKCYKAGIQVKMITGDSVVTARAIAKIIGLKGEAVDEHELQSMNDNELTSRISKISIFARVDAKEKVRIVRILKQMNEIVAVTGDGVNDAPALKRADIGIAMGIRGSDVTRDVADIILTDDNFASIVRAVEEGRRIYDNIKKFIYYLVSTNFAEVLIIFLALLIGSMFGWQILLPLLPLQILWINLVSDNIMAIALSNSIAEHNIMQRKPENLNLLNRRVMLVLLAVSLFITIITLIFFRMNSYDAAKAQTIAFTSLVFLEGFNAFNFSSFDTPIHKMKKHYALFIAVFFAFLLQILIIYMPFFQKIFQTTALSIKELAILAAVSVSVLFFGEMIKILEDYKARRLVKELVKEVEKESEKGIV